MTKHYSPISGIACGPSGYIATAGYDNRVILWQYRKPVARAFHDHLVNQCSFSHDGQLLVTASSDYTARVWSVPHLRLITVLGNHDDDVEMAVFSPDSRLIATASRDHHLRIFDLDGRLLHRFTGHEADVISVTWTTDGHQLLSSSDDGTLRRWSLDTGGLLETIDMDGVETDTVVVGRDGTIFAGTDHGEIHVMAGGMRQVVRAHEAGIKRLALSLDNSLLVSTSYDRTLCTWQCTPNGLVRLGSTHTPPEVWARSVAFDGNDRIVAGTFGSSFAVYHLDRDRWDLEGVGTTNGINAVRMARGAIYSVGDAGLVQRDGETISALGSLCNFLVEWQGRIVSGGHLGCLFDACSGEILIRHHSPLNCATVLDTGELIVGTYTGEGVRVGIDAQTGSVQVRQVIKLHEQAIKGVAANGTHIFSISAAGEAAYHELASGIAVKRIPDAHRKIANGVCVLPNGDFATVSRDLHLRIWRRDGVQEIMSPHDHSIKCIALSANGRWLGTGSYDGQVAFYDLERNRWNSIHRPTFAGISCLSPCDEPDCLLASSYDGKVHQLRVHTSLDDGNDQRIVSQGLFDESTVVQA